MTVPPAPPLTGGAGAAAQAVAEDEGGFEGVWPGEIVSTAGFFILHED